MGQIEIDEPDAAAAGDENVLGLEIQMHEAGIVDVLEGHGGVDQDAGDVLAQNGVGAGEKQLEIRAFHDFHQAIEGPVNFPVFDVPYDSRVLVDFRQDFAPVNEPPHGRED